VEDYTRVITATVPDTDIVGPVAGDLVHLLAELLDNALRYSPPISQVRVSAVHTGTGGLVVEVSDIGLGMTEPDLRVANTRLSSGGEVTPYTARHMGLFVVGRLATAHGLVVRLRSTVDGEQNSGTTAGVFIPAELTLRASDDYDDQSYGTPADAHAGIATALALDEDHDYYAPDEYSAEQHMENGRNGSYGSQPALNGYTDVPASLLPQRAPGASGISGVPDQPDASEPADESPSNDEHQHIPDEWSEATVDDKVDDEVDRPALTDTSSFFASRTQAATNGVHEQSTNGVHETVDEPADDSADELVDAEAAAASDDAIYQKMLSEYLIDPTDIAKSSDLDWQSVWDNGWSVAAAAEDEPVSARTEEGLPLRDPGARLVPGTVDDAAAGPDAPRNGGHRNGGAHRSSQQDEEVASAAAFDSGFDAGEFVPRRDPEAVRASFTSHFSGVHAARSHARDTRGTDTE
jgi:hypothetical protein